jgi:glutamate synthase domain-containing protein 3
MVELHVRRTRSAYAEMLLNNWDQVSGQFWRISPQDSTTTVCDFVDANEQDGLLRMSH